MCEQGESRKEMGLMLPQAREPPEARREAWCILLWLLQRGLGPADPYLSGFWLPELDTFLLMKPLSLWYFIIAALAN